VVVFSRVRRSDVVLGAVAALGLAAGLTLTVTSKFGASGSVFISVGIVAAVAAAARSFWEGAAALRARQSQQSDWFEAICRVPVTSVSAVDPFSIGVFPSELAEREAGDGNVPPYVPRRVDDALRRALSESSLDRSQRLVTLRGDPKSGKSRAMWEAVRTLQDRRLLALVPPVPGSDSTDPGYAPLSTLLRLERPVSRSKGSDLVIWIDDAQLHLQHGLTRDNLRRLVGRYPKVIVVLNIHSNALDGIKDFDAPLHALLRQPFDELILRPVLGPAELAAAKAAYPGLAGNTDLARLPELFAAVNLLTDRYQSHWADEPVGTAVAKAAIDWQRAGMPPGSVDRVVLRALTDLTLREVAPNRVASDDDFDAGLRWSCGEVAAFAALLRREHPGSSGAERYRAFDAVVSWAQVNEGPLPELTWRFVLDHAADIDRVQVGLRAYQGGEMAIARSAFAQVAASGDSSAPVAARHLGVLLKEQGEGEAAKAAYQQAIDSRLPDVAPAAAFNLGNLLAEQGEVHAAKAAYQQAIDSRLPDVAPAAALNLGNLLAEQGEVHAAKAAYQRAIYSGHPEAAPRAAFNLEDLAEQGEAEAADRRTTYAGYPIVAQFSILTEDTGGIEVDGGKYQQPVDSSHPEAREPAMSGKKGGAKVINVHLASEILWIGNEAYPLKDIARVETIQLVLSRGRLFGDYLKAMLLLGFASVVVAVVMRVAGAPSFGLVVVLVVVIVLAALRTVRLTALLSRRSFHALRIETVGASRTLVVRDVDMVKSLAETIKHNINNPMIPFTYRKQKLYIADQIE
jgi:tetratricopeptide (TPR) repeat protein